MSRTKDLLAKQGIQTEEKSGSTRRDAGSRTQKLFENKGISTVAELNPNVLRKEHRKSLTKDIESVQTGKNPAMGALNQQVNRMTGRTGVETLPSLPKLRTLPMVTKTSSEDAQNAVNSISKERKSLAAKQRTIQAQIQQAKLQPMSYNIKALQEEYDALTPQIADLDTKLRIYRKGTGATPYSLGTSVKGVVHKASTGFNRTMANVAAFAEDALLAPFELVAGQQLGELSDNAPLNQLQKYMDKRNDEATAAYQENTAKGGKAAEVGEMLGVSTLMAAPQALLAMLTAGGSTAAQGTAALTQASQAALSPGVATTVRQAVGTMAKDPKYWASFAQVVGDGYEDAMADMRARGDTNENSIRTKAALFAIGNGLFNAAVEQGGVQELPGELQAGAPALRSWVESMVDEGKEEVVQGIIERAMQNLTYDAGNPIASVSDGRAVFNPATMGQEFLGGAVAGGILGAAQVGLGRATSAMLNRQVRQQAGYDGGDVNYQENVQTPPTQTDTARAGTLPRDVDRDVTLMPGARREPSKLNNLDNTATSTYNMNIEGGMPNGTAEGANASYDSDGSFGAGVRAGSDGTGFDTAVADGSETLRRGDLSDAGIVLLSPESTRRIQQTSGVVVDLENRSADSTAFSSALAAARAADGQNGWAVTLKTPEELAGDKVILARNQASGLAVTPDGDIVAVFNNKKAGGPKGATKVLIPTAIANGGTKLDCYGKTLVNIYSRFGFEPVARVEFNPEFANDGWDASKGTPDIYFMVHNGDSADTVAQKMGTYKAWTKAELDALPLMDYDSAAEYRDSILRSRETGNRSAAEGSVGAAQKGFAGAYNDLQNQTSASGFHADGENAYRQVDVPMKDFDGKNISKSAATVMEARAIPDDVVADIQQMVADGVFSYNRITDAESTQRAESTIRTIGYDGAVERFHNAARDGRVSKDLMALGATLLNNAANSRNEKVLSQVLADYAAMSRTAAQATQANRLLKKMSPEWQLMTIQRAVDDLNETQTKRQERKKGKKKKVAEPDSLKATQKVVKDLNERFKQDTKGSDTDVSTDTDGANITVDGKGSTETGNTNEKLIKIDDVLVEKFLQATDQDTRDAVMEEIYQNVADQVPPTWKDKWNAWRYMSMLTNPRTHVRNVIGNLGFQPVRWTKDKIGAALEAAAQKSGVEFERTKSFKSDSAMRQAAKKDFANVIEAMSGSKFSDAKSQIQDRKTIFKSKTLEAIRTFNSNALSAEDMVFKQMTYADSLAGYLTANGVTAEQFTSGNVDQALLLRARDYAVSEAMRATYNDRNAVSDAVASLGNQWKRSDSFAIRAIANTGEGVLPFRRTPTNILVRGFEYSPAGLIKSLTVDRAKVKRGEMNVSQMLDNAAAGLTGTALLALGVFLKNIGWLTTGGGDDEKQDQLDELSGGQNYAINLPGGGSVTVDWLAPEVLPMFMGAELADALDKEGLHVPSLTKLFTATMEPMLEMSMLQSLNDLINSASYFDSGDKLYSLVSSALTSYITQAIPTVLGSAERTSENKRMTTYIDKNSPLPTNIQRTLGSMSARFPVLDFQQIPYIDAWGREESTGSVGERALNNFLNPAYTSQKNVTAADEEVQRLYTATGDTSVVPQRPKNEITVDKKKVYLNSDQYLNYAKTRGKTQYDIVSSLAKNKGYQNLSDTEKAEVISQAYKYADAVGKHAAVPAYEVDGWVADATDAKKKWNVSTADYLLMYGELKAATSDEKESVGKTGNLSIAEEKNAIESLPKNHQQLAWLMAHPDWATDADERGVSTADYIKYKSATAGLKKKDEKIQALRDSGMSAEEARALYRDMTKSLKDGKDD